MSCVALAFISAALRGPGLSSGSRHSAGHLVPADAARARVAVTDTRQVVLVVGDSLVAQSRAALKSQSNSRLVVRIAGRLGNAPCDWTGGGFEAAHPSVVVFAFTGNAGSADGCVGSGKPRAYSLDPLLDNCRESLTELANVAQATGAAVVFSTPPARNPDVPAPPAIPTAKEPKSLDAYYGFQGVSQFRDFYASLVSDSNGHWLLSDAAALAVSPNFQYAPTLACDSEDGPCPSGVVAVRAAGRDAIHLDAEGHGAKRFAKALISSVASEPNPVILARA